MAGNPALSPLSGGLTENQQHKITKARVSIDTFYINLQKDAQERKKRYGDLDRYLAAEKTMDDEEKHQHYEEYWKGVTGLFLSYNGVEICKFSEC